MFTDSNLTFPLTPGAKILTTTQIGTIWLIREVDIWFKVNKNRFGYMVKCEKTKISDNSGARIAAEIAFIKYRAFKAKREVFKLEKMQEKDKKNDQDLEKALAEI